MGLWPTFRLMQHVACRRVVYLSFFIFRMRDFSDRLRDVTLQCVHPDLIRLSMEALSYEFSINLRALRALSSRLLLPFLYQSSDVVDGCCLVPTYYYGDRSLQTEVAPLNCDSRK